MKSVCLVGFKNSGKTTLIQELLPILKKQKLKVTVLKFSHHNFDRSDRDTGKFLNSADQVVGLAPDQTMLSWPSQLPFQDILGFVHSDILLIEGGKHIDFLPRIILNKTPDAELETLDNGMVIGIYSHPAKGVRAPVFSTPQSIANLIKEKSFFIPGQNCAKCGFSDCHALGMAILNGKKTVKDCTFLSNHKMKIKINGQQLLLKDFVQDIIRASILGMLTQLKGYKKGKISIMLEDVDG